MKEKKKVYGTKNPIHVINTCKYLIKENKHVSFPYTGLKCYYGAQGKGKTKSAVKECIDILTEYPKCTFISNVKIEGISNKTFYYKNTQELLEILEREVKEDNKNGYLVLIDEIHIVFASMFAKGVDPIILKWLSQQRKSTIRMIGTTQMFSKIPKALRDYILQSGEIVMCKKLKFFKILQILQVLNMDETDEQNGELRPKTAYFDWYIDTEELYKCYDTFAIISMITEEFKNKKESERIL